MMGEAELKDVSSWDAGPQKTRARECVGGCGGEGEEVGRTRGARRPGPEEGGRHHWTPRRRPSLWRVRAGGADITENETVPNRLAPPETCSRWDVKSAAEHSGERGRDICPQ